MWGWFVIVYILSLLVLLIASLFRISWRCRGLSKEERQAVFQSDEGTVFISLFVTFGVSAIAIILGAMVYRIIQFVASTE
jgi:hypothetical protein